LLSLPALAQIPSPTVDHGTASYPNQTSVWIKCSQGIPCYTMDGSTPGATVAGVCNGEPTRQFSGNDPLPIFTNGMVLKGLCTQGGQTNSAVVTWTYSLTQLSMTQQFVVGATTKITSASGTQVNGLPFQLYDPASGRSSLFFTRGTLAIDNSDPPQKLMLYQSTDGAHTYSPWGDQTNCQGGDPTGCFYNVATHAYWPLGGGISECTGTWVVFVNENLGDGTYGPVAVYPFRSTDKGATWAKQANITAGQSATFWASPTANSRCIPQGSAGISGPCTGAGASGCWIQPMSTQAGANYICYSLDDGQTWPTCIKITHTGGFTLSQPASTEETGLFYPPGGTNLAILTRPGATVYPGGPVNPFFAVSTNMGAADTWNNSTFGGNGGLASNVAIFPCPQVPVPAWSNTFTNPKAVINPQNANRITWASGERAGCNGAVTYDFRIVDFDPVSAVTNSGQNFPLTQTLHLYPPLSENGTHVMPHTGYMSLVPYSANALLLSFECGGVDFSGSSTAEDICQVPLTYSDTGIQGMSFKGVSIK
jgi:hypothetical protein